MLKDRFVLIVASVINDNILDPQKDECPVQLDSRSSPNGIHRYRPALPQKNATWIVRIGALI